MTDSPAPSPPWLLYFGVVVVGLTFAIIAPELGWSIREAAQGYPTAKRHKVFDNMLICARATEAYAKEHKGLYPKSISDNVFKGYFPGGVGPINPVTGIAEWPIEGNITDVIAARQQAPSSIGKGVVEYSVILNKMREPVSYAIRGG
jgi:hypothetical protein